MSGYRSMSPGVTGYRSAAALGLILLCAACGGSGGSGPAATGGSGSLAYSVEWEPPQGGVPAGSLAPARPLAPVIDVCTDYGIDTVTLQVLSGMNVVAESSFPCGAHTGTLNDVHVGNNLILRLQGSIGGSVLWRGHSDNAFAVNPGQTTDAGKVTVRYIGTDIVAPRVVSVSPDNNATNIPNSSTLRIQFSERMAINTVIDNASIRIVDNASFTVPGTVAYNTADNSATFTPAAPFASGGSYTMTVSQDLTDMAGHPLPGPYVSNFAVHAAGTFVRPALIESYDGVSTAPMGIVGDSLGNLLVVGEIRGTPELLWYNRFDAARKQWDLSARVPRESFAPLSLGAMKLVSDNAGNGLLLFEYSMNNIDMTLAAKEYDAVLGWDRNNYLLASSVKSAQVGQAGMTGGHVDIASDGVGNALAVWVTSISGVDSLWARRFLYGVGWEPTPVQLAFTNEMNGTISYPKAAMNSRGDAVVAWGEYSGSTSSVFSVRAIRYAPGTNWEGTISALDNAAPNALPYVVVDGDGNGVSIWRRMSGEVMASHYASGQGWDGPVRINGTDITPGPSQMDIGVDGAGRVVALWANSPAGLKARRFIQGTGWGTSVVVAEESVGPFDYSVNAAGQGVVAWVGGSPTLHMSAARYDGNADTWGNVMTVDDSSATGYLRGFTFVDPSGTPFVIWGWANSAPPNTFSSWVE